MGDQIKQKLRQARDVFLPGDQSSTLSVQKKPGGAGSSNFYDVLDDESNESSSNAETEKPKKRGSTGTAEPLETIFLRHRQLAQALLNVEGIDDDDTLSLSSHSSGSGEVAILRHEAETFASPKLTKVTSSTADETTPHDRHKDSLASIGEDFVDLGRETSSIVDLEQYCFEAIQDNASPWYQRFAVIIMAWFVDLIDAFSETNDDIAIRDESPVRLNAKELRQNIRRCKSQARPYLETLAGIWDLITWRSPLFTLLFFWVYMYCVWKGCVISVVLFLILLQLAINYLSYCRKVKLGLTLLPRKDIKQEIIESPGAQLVLDVARQAQVVLDYVADMLEKVKNLLKWKRPRTTAMFGLLVLFWFSVSLVTTTSIFLTIVGFGFGIKLFVTSYLYYRFPRLRHKLDVVTWFMDRTPADKILSKGSPSHHLNGSPLIEDQSFSSSLPSPNSESPKLSRTCALIDKEKSFPFNIASGKLFLMSNHIIFKYSRWTSGERRVIKIPFDDMLSVRKAKATKMATFGDGMALEIYASGREKPYLFAGIVRRDECYDILMALGRAAGVHWTT